MTIDDAELDLRMTYDLQAKTRLADFVTAAQSLNYLLAIASNAPPEQVLRLAQLTTKDAIPLIPCVTAFR